MPGPFSYLLSPLGVPEGPQRVGMGPLNQARPRGFSHVALSSLWMAVEAGEIEPSHVLSPINFFVWTLSGVKVQCYTNRDAIPKRSVFHSTY
jgi:hypothetical protein